MDWKRIPNDKLEIAKIPSASSSWREIEPFALRFYEEKYLESLGGFDWAAQLANERTASTLTELRASLFFEQRRWRHVGCDPEDLQLVYVQSLLWRIRQCVRRGLLD